MMLKKFGQTCQILEVFEKFDVLLELSELKISEKIGVGEIKTDVE